ncbi:NrdH-redoxin [Metabacillus sp. GX 13764]|uniref:glutaredoxin domain-containing protein n=1 Tax=Metabacillus kandeliae TaxID=2900151 RepID=UPI001E4C9B35|nr:glutaredoxin domain-containing protein [Metabacillus kandeliae]MCD7035467.1 NrdH-redoxin [Metabacillus kandeliae]
MSERVTVYTQNDCPPCKIVKEFLKHHGIEYTELNISTDAKAKNYLTKELNSYSTPTVTAGGGIMKGFDLQKLEQLLGIA